MMIFLQIYLSAGILLTVALVLVSRGQIFDLMRKGWNQSAAAARWPWRDWMAFWFLLVIFPVGWLPLAIGMWFRK